MSSDCQWDDGRYHDWYTFELPGAGEVTAKLQTLDFDEQIQFNAAGGDLLAHTSRPASLTRTLPAGRYRVIATSRWLSSTGTYTLTLTTGRLAIPPPPPPPPPPEVEQPSNDDDGTLSPADTETVRGHVIARVHPLPENDRRGNYRIEFGFLSEEVLSSGTDRTTVVDANTHLLPPRRYLNESSLLARAQANDRRWLRSSPIDVFPLTGDDANLEGQPLLTGRVIARWSPTPGGRFRVEFGFLPDWAFEAAGGDTQRAAETYASLLPDPGRYLTESRINSELRRDQPRWLTSSVVEIPDTPPGTSPPCVGPAIITPTAVPLTLPRGEPITDESIATINGQLAETFTPVVVSGLPPGLEWDLDESRADGCEYQLTVSGTILPQAVARTYSVSVTAEGAMGEATTSTIRLVLSGEDPIEITWGGYNPASTSIGGAVGIIQPRVTSPLPAPSPVTWRFETRTTSICSVDARTGALTLLATGACQVTITASAAGYASATASAQVTVDVAPPPVISWSGYARNAVEYGETAPTILPPSATVNGRSVSPAWRYSVAPASSAVCRVNEATGALTTSSTGDCRVIVTNVAKPPEYGVGMASASVRINPGDPTLRWDGYSPATARVGKPAPSLRPPSAANTSIRFGYSSLTPSICDADPATGALRLLADGTCIVQVSTSGDPNYRAAQQTSTIVVSEVTPPVISWAGYEPANMNVGGASRLLPPTARVNGRMVNGLTYRYSVAPASSGVCSVNPATGSLTATAQGTCEISVTSEATADYLPATAMAVVRVTIQPPIVSINCSPTSPYVNDSITCTVRNSGGPINSYSWSGGDSSSRSETYRTSFSSSGTKTVSLTASNAGGSASDRTTVGVVPRNRPPECDIPSTVSLSLDLSDRDPSGHMDIVDVCTDPDGDTLRFAASSSSSTIVSVSSPSGSRASIKITGESRGTATITVSATDPNGLSDSASFPATVTGTRITRPDIEISCSPSPTQVNVRVTCAVDRNRGDSIDSYSWSGGDSSNRRSSIYRTTFSSSGRHRVELTARNSAGSGSDRTYVSVEEDTDPPDIEISCSPSSTQVHTSVTCTVSNRGGSIDTYSWSGGNSSDRSSSRYRTSFITSGTKTVSLTASNDGGSDSAGTTVTVDPLPPPLTPPPGLYAYCSPDAIKVYYFDAAAGLRHHVDVPWEFFQRRIYNGRVLNITLSAAECAKWTVGRRLTEVDYD